MWLKDNEDLIGCSCEKGLTLFDTTIFGRKEIEPFSKMSNGKEKS